MYSQVLSVMDNYNGKVSEESSLYNICMIRKGFQEPR